MKFPLTFHSLYASQGDATLLFTLVRYQFDPTIIDGLGNTALHVAAARDAVEAARVLMENGADIEEKDSYG